MRLVFVSSAMNHHQLPFCMAMVRAIGDDFKFIATKPVTEERLKLGYHDYNNQFDFIITAYENEEKYNQARMLNYESDVSIVGSAPEEFVSDRAYSGKLTFRYSERLYKTSIKHAFSPQFVKEICAIHTPMRKKNVYMLCAGAYVSFDYGIWGHYKNKTYKWGYFPETREHNLKQLFEKKNEDKKMKLLWVGRMLDWKHPELSIIVADKLKKLGYNFVLDIIGTGPMEDELRNMVETMHLQEHVCFWGSMSPDNVRQHMEKAHVFLFTSDRNEGWGAVLNEAMNSGCVVICNKAIGAVPFMVVDKENGLIYSRNNSQVILQLVKKVLDNPEMIEQLGTNAYFTIEKEWNAQVASERFLNLSQRLLTGKDTQYSEGICSKC